MATFLPYPAEIREARTPPDPPPITTRSYSSASASARSPAWELTKRVDKARSGTKAADLVGTSAAMRARELINFITFDVSGCFCL